MHTRGLLSEIICYLRRLPESYGSLIPKVREAKAINNRDWLLCQLQG